MELLSSEEALQYRNQAFAIHHLIADCPPSTVIRELVKNAEENAVLLDPPGRIEWFVEHVAGVPKLGLFNEGPGMAGEELSRLMDLASTGKLLGIDHNYGQGGKISGLKVSPHGVVYRSCKAGRVSQIMLAAEHVSGSDFPVYVKRGQAVPSGRLKRPLDRDWTEVVLLGCNALHDTVHELLPDLRVKNWLMRLLNARFFRFPDGVVVDTRSALVDCHGHRAACGLEKLTVQYGEKRQDVAAEHPRFGSLVVRYCKLWGHYREDEGGNQRARAMEAHGLGSHGDHVCLVWKNECYDMHVSWSRISGAFGVMYGSSNVAIQILLPDKAPVKNNTYRDLILDRGVDHQPVRVEAFADLVRAHRPKWLVKYIESEARKNTNHSGVMKRLQSFLDDLKAPAEARFEVRAAGEDQGEAPRRTRRGTGSESDDAYPIDSTPKRTRPATGSRLPSRLPGIPQVSFAEDPAILEETSGRAGMYRREENAILLNPHHSKYLEDLERLFEDVGPAADRRALAKKLFDDEYCFNAGKFVIQAWWFKGKPFWEDGAWEEGVNMRALTVHLALPDSLDGARRKLRQKLNSRKLETPSV
jgi:hypothetical protein